HARVGIGAGELHERVQRALVGGLTHACVDLRLLAELSADPFEVCVAVVHWHDPIVASPSTARWERPLRHRAPVGYGQASAVGDFTYHCVASSRAATPPAAPRKPTQ